MTNFSTVNAANASLVRAEINRRLESVAARTTNSCHTNWLEYYSEGERRMALTNLILNTVGAGVGFYFNEAFARSMPWNFIRKLESIGFLRKTGNRKEVMRPLGGGYFHLDTCDEYVFKVSPETMALIEAYIKYDAGKRYTVA